jgi:hypothetical protein
MSGEKCGRWRVVYDGTGQPYSQLYAYNEMMVSKIALLGGHGRTMPAVFRGSTAGLESVVSMVNANTDLYNSLYHARARLGAGPSAASSAPIMPNRADPLSDRAAKAAEKARRREAAQQRHRKIDAGWQALANRARVLRDLDPLCAFDFEVPSDEIPSSANIAELERLAAQREEELATATQRVEQREAEIVARRESDQRAAALQRHLDRGAGRKAAWQAEVAERSAFSRRHYSVVEAIAERRAGQHEALELLGEMAVLNDPALMPVREALAAVERGDGRMTAELRQRAGHALDRARRSAVNTALTQVFGKLGYAVGEGFDQFTFENDKIYFQPGTWRDSEFGDYAVELRIENGDWASRVVKAPQHAATPEDHERDGAAQRAWETEYRGLVAELAKSGVTIEMTHAEAPGKTPVPVLDDGKLAALTARRRTTHHDPRQKAQETHYK